MLAEGHAFQLIVEVPVWLQALVLIGGIIAVATTLIFRHTRRRPPPLPPPSPRQ